MFTHAAVIFQPNFTETQWAVFNSIRNYVFPESIRPESTQDTEPKVKKIKRAKKSRAELIAIDSSSPYAKPWSFVASDGRMGRQRQGPRRTYLLQPEPDYGVVRCGKMLDGRRNRSRQPQSSGSSVKDGGTSLNSSFKDGSTSFNSSVKGESTSLNGSIITSISTSLSCSNLGSKGYDSIMDDAESFNPSDKQQFVTPLFEYTVPSTQASFDSVGSRRRLVSKSTDRSDLLVILYVVQCQHSLNE